MILHDKQKSSSNQGDQRGGRSGSVLTDVVNRSSAELSVELFGSEAPEVVYGERPEVENVVPGEGVSLLQQHHPSP